MRAALVVLLLLTACSVQAPPAAAVAAPPVQLADSPDVNTPEGHGGIAIENDAQGRAAPAAFPQRAMWPGLNAPEVDPNDFEMVVDSPGAQLVPPEVRKLGAEGVAAYLDGMAETAYERGVALQRKDPAAGAVQFEEAVSFSPDNEPLRTKAQARLEKLRK